MKVVFHLGIHKTASTFFQKNVFPKMENTFFMNRSMFRDLKIYILYENDFSFDPLLGRELFKKILYRNNYHQEGIIIISDEEFSGNPFLGAIDRKRNAERIVKIFGEESLKFVVFLRNQVELTNSLYNQYVKTGGSAKFDDFIKHNRYPLIFNSNYLEFDGYLKYLRENSNLVVFLYEDFIKNKPKVLEKMCLSIGVTMPKNISYDKTVNSSLTTFELPVMRFLNKLISSPKTPFLLFNISIHSILKKIFLRLKFGKKTDYKLKGEILEKIKSSNYQLETIFPELNITHYNYPNKRLN